MEESLFAWSRWRKACLVWFDGGWSSVDSRAACAVGCSWSRVDGMTRVIVLEADYARAIVLEADYTRAIVLEASRTVHPRPPSHSRVIVLEDVAASLALTGGGLMG
jgi:hypothetical protein